MAKFIVQVRTENDLQNLLATGESPAWIISQKKVQLITHVRIVNFEGTQMIEGVFDRHKSYRREDGRLVLCFLDAHIVKCRVKFDSRNPVRYI
jgi:hypothetical protein